MKVRVGDKVKILTGKDKGKEGTVIYTLKKKDKVVVEGINKVKKHLKPGRTNENGQILEVENPIHVSNVKVIEEKKVSKKETKKEVKKETAKKTTRKSTKKEVGEK